MGGTRAFHDPGRITGFRLLGWQFDWRPDGWLPLSVRRGCNPGWLVIPFGKGNFTVGRLYAPRRSAAEQVVARLDSYSPAEHVEGIKQARERSKERRLARRLRAQAAAKRRP